MTFLEGYSASEKRNVAIYIAGIMLYKFALETLNGCISSLVLSRVSQSLGPNAIWTTMLSINYACQCIGSVMVAPLAKRYRTNTVLACAVTFFGLFILIVPILELSTGGGSGSGFGDEKKYSPGTWNPLILFGIFPISGIFYGMVELIRRVIPSDIVGVDENKLKQMDSLVHICYETSGTIGALLSAYWIAYFNYAYALTIIPMFFTLSAIVWRRVSLETEQNLEYSNQGQPVFQEVKAIAHAFMHSVVVGAKLVLTRRSLVWLVFAYTLPLVLHRYLENVLFSQYANGGLGVGSYQQKLVAGSNLGELCGAFFILLFTKAVATPLPWLRLDAITLLIVWVFPFAQPFGGVDVWIWILFGIVIFVSFGWAAGDVSLVAFIQSRLARINFIDNQTSPLGAVMAFLYVLYIVLFAIISPVMGLVMDSFLSELTQQYGENIPIELRLPAVRRAMVYTGGVFMTVCAVIIFCATFIPRGSFAFNPQIIEESDLISRSENNDKDLELDEKAKAKAAVTEMIVS